LRFGEPVQQHERERRQDPPLAKKRRKHRQRSAAAGHDIVTAAELPIAAHLRHLYTHLLENRHVVGVTDHDPAALAVPSRDVLRRIQTADPSWALLVPPEAAALIRDRHLFGCR